MKLFFKRAIIPSLFSVLFTAYTSKAVGQEMSKPVAIERAGLSMTVYTDNGEYFHNRHGMWRISRVVTSSGKEGIAKVFYAGVTFEGCLYREEIWIDGKLVYANTELFDRKASAI